MENASKALIIAGAILLSILIISLGIVIYNQAAGVVDQGSMDEVSVSTFNQKFTQYEGDNIRGTNVNSLINSVVQNNLTNSGDSSKQISIEFDGTLTNWNPANKSGTVSNPTTASSVGKALTGKSYKVSTEADSKSGYVTKIKIKEI